MTYSPEFHWRLAAHWNRKTLAEFIAQDGAEMSRDVAAYETAMQMDAVIQLKAVKERARRQHHV